MVRRMPMGMLPYHDCDGAARPAIIVGVGRFWRLAG
jgi:hypothetical protein